MAHASAEASESYIIGVDGGTEGIRAGIFDLTGHPLAYATTPYASAYPQPSWVEQNPHGASPPLPFCLRFRM